MNYFISAQDENASILNAIIFCASALSLLPTPIHATSHHSVRPTSVYFPYFYDFSYLPWLLDFPVPFSFHLILYHKNWVDKLEVRASTFLYLLCCTKRMHANNITLSYRFELSNSIGIHGFGGT